MPATGSPTARRRELGFILRSLRTGMGLTAEQVAERLGVSASKVSRLENGQRGASRADIRRLCELYQVDDEQCQRLTELAAEGKQRAWWQTPSLPYAYYVGLEAEATSISDFGLAIVPGLLQTPDYARAVLSASVPAWEPQIIEERLWARMARQQRLLSNSAPTFEAVLDESVLHRVVGGPAVMLPQLQRLLEMSELPTVSIRVLPYDAGAVPAGVNKFIILRFAQPGIPDTVFIEELTNDRYLMQRQEVATYTATWQALDNLSADPAASRAFVHAKIATYQSQIR